MLGNLKSKSVPVGGSGGGGPLPGGLATWSIGRTGKSEEDWRPNGGSVCMGPTPPLRVVVLRTLCIVGLLLFWSLSLVPALAPVLTLGLTGLVLIFVVLVLVPVAVTVAELAVRDVAPGDIVGSCGVDSKCVAEKLCCK